MSPTTYLDDRIGSFFRWNTVLFVAPENFGISLAVFFLDFSFVPTLFGEVDIWVILVLDPVAIDPSIDQQSPRQEEFLKVGAIIL